MGQKYRACNEALLARLQSANPEEIDLLVDVITDFSKGRASLSAECKKKLVMARYSPRVDRYDQSTLDLISEEIQAYGGNSAMNVARRVFKRPSVTYEEIVDDVFRKLNGKDPDGKSVAQKEREIALGLFGEEWRVLSPQERLERSTSARVLSGTFFINDAPGDMISGFASSVLKNKKRNLIAAVGLRLNPAGAVVSAGLAVHSTLAEAYRVTVPFVAQMGCIRLQQELDTEQSAAPALNGGQFLDANATNSLELTDENGGALMRIRLFDREPEVAGNDLSEQQISVFNPLMASLPGLAALAEQRHGNYVLCSLPFDALTKAKSGEGMRAWVTQGERIKGHATLLKPEGLQNILVSGAIWNAVSTAVAQKHLHDINEKLTTITRQLDALQADLDNGRRYKLDGLIQYVQSLLDHYPIEGIDGAAQLHLEQRLIDLYELERHFKERIAHEEASASKLELGQFFSADSSRQKLEGSLTKLQEWATAYLQVVQLRVVSYALLYMANPLSRYRSEASRVLEGLADLPMTAARNQQIFNAQMAMSHSFLFSVEESQKQHFTGRLEALTDDLKEGPVIVQQLHQSFFDQSDRKILLRMENGKPVSGRLLV